MKLKITALLLCVLTVLGCQTKQGTGTLVGTGGGAVLGAIIGKIAGNTAVGAAIGGVVGAGTGAIIGRHMDKVAEQAKAQVENAKVGILFATNKSDLNAISKNELAKFSNVLKQNTDCYVDIYGHTDSTGNDGINIPLSNSRAQSVATYLRQCGISDAQMKKVEGYGSSQPVADNSTASGRQLNRRVEIYLYASQAMVDSANAGKLN